MCGNSSAGLGERRKARAKKYNTETFRNGQRNRERDALRNLGRSSRESERSLLKGSQVGSFVDLVTSTGSGKRHREKAGTKSVAIKLYGKRKQHVLEGKSYQRAFQAIRQLFATC